MTTMTGTSVPSTTVPFEAEIRWILQAAMVLFIYTVAIGILNGLDLVTFERPLLLAHLHVGTLGWITMAVFAGSLALFGEGSEDNQMVVWGARLAPLAAAGYNVAFLTTTNIARPIMGTVMMLIILGFAVWGFSQARGRALSVPHIGMLAGLAMSVVGAVLGILLGVAIARPDLDISEAVAGAHPAAMVIGFLVPVGMTFAEWVMRPESAGVRARLGGWLQIGLPFIGGVLAVVGILADVVPLVMVATLFELVGLGIFLARVAPRAISVSWLSPSMARHGVAAGIFLVVNILILVYLVMNYAEDFEAAPRRLFLALDHSIFVGVQTMAILAIIARFSMARRPAWVDHAVFWGVTLGVTAFLAGLLSDTDALIRIGTPVLGAAILLAVAVHVPGMGNPRAAWRM